MWFGRGVGCLISRCQHRRRMFVTVSLSPPRVPSLPSALDIAARHWKTPQLNPNRQSVGAGNTQFALDLLRYFDAATPHINVVINPLTIGHRIARLCDVTGINVDDADAAAATAERIVAEMTKTTAVSLRTVDANTFTAPFAPTWRLTVSDGPAWFMPTADRADRYAADMIVRAGRWFYNETAHYQTVDIHYLTAPDIVFTLIAPRSSTEDTIGDHPDDAYYAQTRYVSDVSAVLALLNAQCIHHEAHYRSLMHGAVIMPTFSSDYTMSVANHTFGRSSFGIDSDGLPRGRTQLRGPKYGPSHPTFVLSAHRPFIWIIRHLPTNGVIRCGTVRRPKRRPFVAKFPQRKIEWIEDSEPVVQV